MYDRAATKYGVDRSNTEALQSAVKEYINFPQLAAAIRGKKHILQGQKDVTAAHIANNLDWAAQSNLLTDKIGDTGYYVVPGSENYDNWSYIAYNPITRHYEEQSMLLNEELKKKMAYAEYDRRNKDVQKHQLGGLLEYTEEYQKKAQKEAEKQQRIDQKVEETGKTREQVEAAERRPMEEGFSTIDKIRLGTAAADAISAAAAFIPGYGTVASGVLGIGSTLTNIGADIADESMSGWDVAGNALYGLGMDVVGLIPGMGATGKAAKIVRVLKPVSKLVMKTLLAYGMMHSVGAFNKLMSNPSDMSADDWRNLVTGLQTISGGAGYKGGERAVSRATTQRDVADVKTSTGRMATISKEDLDKLRKTKGLKAQNKLFSELTGGQKLQREFKGREFNWKQPWKSRLHSDNPEFSTRTESTFFPEDTSWDARLFRGMQKKEGNSKKKPSQQTTASNFDRLRNLSSQTGKLTPQEIATINRQRVKSGKGKLTQQEIEALNQRRSNRAGSAEDNSFQARLARYKQDKKDGKFNSVEDDIKRAKDELAEATRQQRLAVPTGQGSIVSPDAKEARFIMGLSKTIPTVNPSRPPITNPPAIIPRQQIEIPKPQTTPFNSQRIREGLERAQRERLGRDIGDTRIQRAIESNPERTARLQAQEAYRNVRQYFNMYGVPQYKKPLTGTARRSKQNTYNQLFGDAMQDALRNRPLPHKQSNKKKKTSRDNRRTVKREEGGILDKVRKFDGGGITETARKATQYALNNNWFTNLYNQKSLTGWDSSKDASKAVYADRINRRMTDLAKASVTPLLKDPFQVHRYTRSDLDAEMQGERNYANLRRLASRPITSDGSLQTATQLQAEVQGQEARTAGKEKSNQTQRQYDELAWQQEKENAANRHETAMFNRAQQWGADQYKSKFEQAYLSKKFNILDTFGQQLEYDARTKQQENKALADNFARSDIHNAVNYAPNDYGANLTPEELTVWNKVLSGTNPSSLSTQEFNSYRLAAQKVSRVETDQLRQHYNIPNTRWSGKAGVPNTPWSASISFVKKGGIISAKNGSKIAVAGIEAKTADAERFQKQIKDCIDRNEKTLDRLSKSLYGLIKASMIK